MTYKVYFFSFIMLFSSVFTFGDAFFVQVKNEILGLDSKEHHHVDVVDHDKEHKNEKHSDNCEDECHFCLFTGSISVCLHEFRDVEFLNITKETTESTFFYLLLNTDCHLNGIWQPPKFIS